MKKDDLSERIIRSAHKMNVSENMPLCEIALLLRVSRGKLSIQLAKWRKVNKLKGAITHKDLIATLNKKIGPTKRFNPYFGKGYKHARCKTNVY